MKVKTSSGNTYAFDRGIVYGTRGDFVFLSGLRVNRVMDEKAFKTWAEQFDNFRSVCCTEGGVADEG